MRSIFILSVAWVWVSGVSPVQAVPSVPTAEVGTKAEPAVQAEERRDADSAKLTVEERTRIERRERFLQEIRKLYENHSGI
jgi:hypothetical protein